ncbi:hypothetical protein ACFLZT_00180 [Thermodesulfobacteriota bacterium]
MNLLKNKERFQQDQSGTRTVMHALRLLFLLLLLPAMTVSCAGLKLPEKDQSEEIIIIDIAMSAPGLWRMPTEIAIRNTVSNEIFTGEFTGFQGLTIFTDIKQGRFAIQTISGSTLEYSPDGIKPRSHARPELNQIRYHILELPEGAAEFTINRSGLYYLGKYEASVIERYSTANETYYNLVSFERAPAVEEREELEFIKDAALRNAGWTQDDIIYNRKK